MLKQWTSHAEYLRSVSDAVLSINNSQRKIFDSYSKSLQKLTSLDLDPLLTILTPFYSYMGRFARNHPEIFRSFILMFDLGETSIDRLWLRHKYLDKADRKRLYHFHRSKCPTSKPGKGKKLPNRHPDIVKKFI